MIYTLWFVLVFTYTKKQKNNRDIINLMDNVLYNQKFMQLAINEARDGIKNGDGGPFGAVVVRNGEVIASGHNHVLSRNDSTCHGEIDAIRKAEQKLSAFDLSGCEIYTTSEPCPMCLSAILWANISKVYYGCTLRDNEKIGFRDVKFDKIVVDSAAREELLEEHDREACLEVFEEYNQKKDKVNY